MKRNFYKYCIYSIMVISLIYDILFFFFFQYPFLNNTLTRLQLPILYFKGQELIITSDRLSLNVKKLNRKWLIPKVVNTCEVNFGDCYWVQPKKKLNNFYKPAIKSHDPMARFHYKNSCWFQVLVFLYLKWRYHHVFLALSCFTFFVDFAVAIGKVR